MRYQVAQITRFCENHPYGQELYLPHRLTCLNEGGENSVFSAFTISRIYNEYVDFIAWFYNTAFPFFCLL